MATSVNFPTYGFINDTLALNEENWRKFFKPFVYDSVQSGLVTTAGTGMTVNVSGGECRCGAVMGVLDGAIALDIDNGHATYNRIDSIVVQYSYGTPSTLSVAVKRGTATANPVAPTLSKVYNTLWEMEIAQVLIPAGATDSSGLTITDKRVMYDSVQSIIDDNAGNGDTDVVWSADKSYDQITDLKNSIEKNTNYSIASNGGVNICDYSGSEYGYYYGKDGVKTYTNGTNTTKLMQIPPFATELKIIGYAGGKNANTIITFWDSQGVYTNNYHIFNDTSTQIYKVPNGSTYFRLAFYDESKMEVTVPLSALINLNTFEENAIRNKIISTLRHASISNNQEVYNAEKLLSDYISVDDYYVAYSNNKTKLIFDVFIYNSIQDASYESIMSSAEQVPLVPGKFYRFIFSGNNNNSIDYDVISYFGVRTGWLYNVSNNNNNPTVLSAFRKNMDITLTSAYLNNILNDNSLPSFAKSRGGFLKCRQFSTNIYGNSAYVTNQIFQFYPNENSKYIATYQRTIRTSNGTTINDWCSIDGVSVLAHKKISIYGDSISTYSGWIPSGNSNYYPHSTTDTNPVNNVNKTWWKETIDALNFELVVNNSWSGRCVLETEARAGYKEANVLQLKKQVDGVDVIPDIIIVRLGGNDFKNGDYPLGTYDGTTVLPTTDPPTTFLDAYAIMLHRILTNFPLAQVYCCTITEMEYNTSKVGFPEINPLGESLPEWNDAIKKIANAFGLRVIDHAACGITYYNRSYYFQDYNASTSGALHPNALGHALMANLTIHELDNYVRTRY